MRLKMNIYALTSFIIFPVLCLAGFITLYFFFLPGVLVKKLAGYSNLESGGFSRQFRWNENLVKVSGYKREHFIQILFEHHFIIPEFEVVVLPKDKTKYNFIFLENYTKIIRNWMIQTFSIKICCVFIGTKKAREM